MPLTWRHAWPAVSGDGFETKIKSTVQYSVFRRDVICMSPFVLLSETQIEYGCIYDESAFFVFSKFLSQPDG
jgi:hypothetical protein